MLTCQNKLNRDSTSGQVYLDQRNQSVAEIMDGARVGNVLLDFGSQFTHAFWMGASTYTPVYRPECTRGRTLAGCLDLHNGPVLPASVLCRRLASRLYMFHCGMLANPIVTPLLLQTQS